LVLGADDFSEFLTRTQVASRVAAHDRTVIEKMRVELAKISALKDQIQDDKSEVEASKGQMAVKQSQLGQELTKTQDQIQDMSALESEYKANKAKIDAEMKQVQSEVDEIYKQINSVGDYEGGVMIWPVPGYKRISSEYGWRFGGTDYHTGIDISGSNAAGQGIYGKPIVAAAAGKVAFTQLTFVQGRGYGRYIIIDHGGGISSLYGHTSGLAVKVGDTVTRGQTIAYVGSTGWSTGPHLHFEVRVNGKHTPPRPYLGI
ncbi:MAG: peptidoglycan DD-metalloendopeptidase family protein, partial [Oscillospiraceae bacterium]